MNCGKKTIAYIFICSLVASICIGFPILCLYGKTMHALNLYPLLIAIPIWILISISGIVFEVSMRRKNIDSSQNDKSYYFIARLAFIVFLITLFFSLIVLIRYFAFFRNPVLIGEIDGKTEVPEGKVVTIDSYQVLSYLGKYESKNESINKSSQSILPDYYLISMTHDMAAEEIYVIVVSASKAASEKIQYALDHSLLISESTGYLRRMNEQEKERVFSYSSENSIDKKVTILPYCVNDIYIKGLPRYSVFRPVDVSLLSLLTACLSFLLFFRIVNVLRPSLRSFLFYTDY